MPAEKKLSEVENNETPGIGGARDFKIPLPSGYDWEVTQSWSDHCELCNNKGYNKIHNGFFGDYCELSHSHACESKCKYSWDFNLPGSSDEGKPVLASANGLVKTILYDHGAWGNAVIIDHGDNICTRSAHLLDNSIRVNAGDNICQGLKIAEIGGTPYYSPHLHFQFETCDTQEPLAIGFSDGNGIPVCTMGADIYNQRGDYDFLILNNNMKESCDKTYNSYSDDSCSQLKSCPMNKYCNKSFNHHFNDEYTLSPILKKATDYLWSECAIDENENGDFDKYASLTRAESVKSVINGFGLYEACHIHVPYEDVGLNDWFYPYIACAVKNHIINSMVSNFMPYYPVTSAEAIKMIVVAAQSANLLNFVKDKKAYFKEVPKDHWSYIYYETLDRYGNLSFSLDNIPRDGHISKGEFALIMASLSPCFCGNVPVETWEICDQESFSCIDK